MDWLIALFDNQIVLVLTSGAGGILLTVVTQQILNKRSLFTYLLILLSITRSARLQMMLSMATFAFYGTKTQ